MYLILAIAHASAFSPNWSLRPSVAPVMLFGLGRDASSGLADTVLKARKALESNQAFKARTEQVSGCFLEWIVYIAHSRAHLQHSLFNTSCEVFTVLTLLYLLPGSAT